MAAVENSNSNSGGGCVCMYMYVHVVSLSWIMERGGQTTLRIRLQENIYDIVSSEQASRREKKVRRTYVHTYIQSIHPSIHPSN